MVERFLSNFVLAMALTVVETWERARAAEKSRAIFNHPILHEESLDARDVIRLFDQ